MHAVQAGCPDRRSGATEARSGHVGRRHDLDDSVDTVGPVGPARPAGWP
jgi:hypothetical protein